MRHVDKQEKNQYFFGKRTLKTKLSKAGNQQNTTGSLNKKKRSVFELSIKQLFKINFLEGYERCFKNNKSCLTVDNKFYYIKFRTYRRDSENAN